VCDAGRYGSSEHMNEYKTINAGHKYVPGMWSLWFIIAA
jgi:hypothetical protein